MPITINTGSGAENLTSSSFAFKLTYTPPSNIPYGISNIVARQTPGTSNQAEVTFFVGGFPEGSTIYGRFISNYTGDGTGAVGTITFGITQSVRNEDGSYTLYSAANLVPGTTYRALLYVTDGTTNDPASPDCYVSNPVAITSTLTAPTSISPGTINVPYGTASGTVIATLAADALNCTYSEGSPDNELVSIASNGQVTLTGAATTAGTTTIKATATNSAGSVNADLSLVVAAQPATGGGTADYTETSLANLVSRVNTLLSDSWTGEKVIELAAGTYTGNLLLTSKAFLSGGRGELVIRGGGTPTVAGHPCKIYGDVRLTNSSGIRLELMQILPASAIGGVEVSNITDVTLNRLLVQGVENPNTGTIPSKDFLIHHTAGTATRLKIRDVVVEGARLAAVKFNQPTTDLLVEWMAFDYMSGDYFKMENGQHQRPIFRHNLLAARYNSLSTADYHEDGIQIRGGTPGGTIVTGMVWEYNLTASRVWSGGSGPAHQQVFFGAGSEGSNNITVTQNFFFCDGPGVASDGGVTLVSVTYNACLIPNGSHYDGAFSGTVDYNVTVSTSAGATKGAGPNGLVIVAPSTENSTGLKPRPILTDNSPYDTYYDGDMSRTCNIEAFKPKVGQLTHWTHANPVGPHLLAKQIFEDGIHWWNRGWPVAVVAARVLGSGAGIAGNTYTGTFNADGSNA